MPAPAPSRSRVRPTRRGRAALLLASVVVLVAALAVPAAVVAGLLGGADDAVLGSPAGAPSAGAPSAAASPSGSAARTGPSVDPSTSASAVGNPPSAPSPEASPSAAALVGPRPAPDEAVVAEGTGELTVVPGEAAPLGDGPVLRYLVEVEGGLGVDPQGFAAHVHRILGDPRGWGAGGTRSFQRVDAGPVDFRVALASPATTDRLCLPLDTAGIFSCEIGGRATINLGRWLQGADAYGDDVEPYREYVISHEVGHALGHGHVYGCLPDGRAHVMQQQTKGLAGCSRNPWPEPDAPLPLPTR